MIKEKKRKGEEKKEKILFIFIFIIHPSLLHLPLSLPFSYFTTIIILFIYNFLLTFFSS